MAAMQSEEQQAVLERLGQQFRRLRLKHNISQDILAAEAGVGLSTLKRFESGRGCNLAALTQLMKALDCLDELEQFFAQLAGDEEAPAGSGADSRKRASNLRKRE